MTNNNDKNNNALPLDEKRREQMAIKWEEATMAEPNLTAEEHRNGTGWDDIILGTSPQKNQSESPPSQERALFSSGQVKALQHFFEEGFEQTLFQVCDIEKEETDKISLVIHGLHQEDTLRVSFTKAGKHPIFEYSGHINGEEVCKNKDSIPALSSLKSALKTRTLSI